MKLSYLDLYTCPNCGIGKFSVEVPPDRESDGELMQGQLSCDQCQNLFPINGGIPRFVSMENYTSSFGFQWNLHRETQLDSYTGCPITANRLFGVTQWPRRMNDQLILEAGSGAGRFTEVLLATGARVFSFDFSSAVEANYISNGKHLNLHLFQADIFNIPLRRGAFDKVLCLGVLQHTSDPERALKSLALHVRPGGELVVDIYAKRLVSLLSWKYLLRPITKRLNKKTLYKIVASTVPPLLPLAILLRRVGGKYGARLLPIVEYSYLGLPYELNKQWAILDTFDMYSPQHDHPQKLSTVKRWFFELGFVDADTSYGPNGIVAKARRPELPAT